MTTLRHNACLLLGALAAVVATPSIVRSQAAPSPSAAAAAPAQDLVKMNPFEVVDEPDNSFTTSSVGTGGRLVLDLKDVPASYEVINRAFIDALGITDMTEAASWAPGQTFQPTMGTAANANAGSVFGYQVIVQRGLATSTTPNSGNSNNAGGGTNGAMLNFYQNSNAGNQDSYATESYDFGQGPNGILFGGAGSASGDFGAAAGLSGVSSVQSKRARLDRSTTVISAELGNWQYKRVTFDYNRPISDRIGVRLNAVDSNTHAWIDHNETSKRGLALTGTFKLTNTTDFSLNLSYDHSNNHNVIQPNENVSGWDGRTVGRGLILSTMLPGTQNNTQGLSSTSGSILGTTTPLNWGGEANGVQRFGGNTSNYYWDMTTNQIVNMRGMLITRRADATSRVPLWTSTAPNGQFFTRGTVVNSTVNGVPTNFQNSMGVSQRSWLNLTGLPLDMFDRASANSNFKPWGPRQNFSYWGSGQENKARDMQFSLSQRLGNDLSVGLGGDWNRNQGDGRLADRGLNTVQLDINQLLPDGSPNPHFLDMFSQSGGDGQGLQHSITVDMALRANIAYNLNFGRWGSYSLNVNGNANQRTYDFYRSKLAMTRNIDPRVWVTSDVIKMKIYQGQGVYREPRTLTNFTLLDSTWKGTGTEGDTNAYIPTPVTSSVQTIYAPELNGSAGAQYNNYLSSNLAFQTTARWLDGKLVFLGGFRRDRNMGLQHIGQDQAYYPSIDPITRPGGFVVPTGRWDGKTTYYKPIWSGSVHDYYNLRFFQRDASGKQVGSSRIATSRPTTNLPGGLDGAGLNNGLNVMDPRYMTDQFQNDYSPPKSITFGTTKTYGWTYNMTPWFAPFINRSDQFLPPSAANVDIFNEERSVVFSRGTDFGARFNFFKGRLSMKYDYYNTSRLNNPTGNNVITQINNLINANRWDDIDTTTGASTAINQLGIDPISSTGDYSTSRNYGYEWEITGQLSKSLRLSLNGTAGSDGTDPGTSNPLTYRYMTDATKIDDFRRILEDAGGSLDKTQKPISNGHTVEAAPGLAVLAALPGKGIGLDTTNAVNAYNNIWVQYDQLASSPTRTRHQPNANFFADYTVQSGPMRGLRVGAGLQWQGVRSVGNKSNWTVINPTNSATSIDDPAVNNTDQIWTAGAIRTQLNFSYTFKLKNSGTLVMGLRVNGLGDNPIMYGAVLRQPEGDLTKPNRVTNVAGDPYAIQQPLNFRLTATYTFGNGSGGR